MFSDAKIIIILVKNRGCTKTKRVRKHRVITFFFRPKILCSSPFNSKLGQRMAFLKCTVTSRPIGTSQPFSEKNIFRKHGNVRVVTIASRPVVFACRYSN